MKKFVSLLTLTAMLMTIAACAAEAEDAGFTATVETLEDPDDLEYIIDDHVWAMVDELEVEWDALTEELDTFGYKRIRGKIAAFYDSVVSTTEALCIDLRAYSVDYARLILAQDASNDEKCTALYDCLYDEILDYSYSEIYDIYDYILLDMFDFFFDAVIDDSYEDASYSDWSDARSAEISNWSYACSAVLSELSDCYLDISGFWSDLTNDILQDDPEGALDETDDFQVDVERLARRAGHNIVWHVAATTWDGDAAGTDVGDAAITEEAEATAPPVPTATPTETATAPAVTDEVAMKR